MQFKLESIEYEDSNVILVHLLYHVDQGSSTRVREGYLTKYNALRILKLESLDHGCARVAHCVTAR